MKEDLLGRMYLDDDGIDADYDNLNHMIRTILKEIIIILIVTTKGRKIAKRTISVSVIFFISFFMFTFCVDHLRLTTKPPSQPLDIYLLINIS